MAAWLRGRAKFAALLGLLKDHTAAGLARASGPFAHLQVAIVMATDRHESLPEEKYVEEIIAAGSGSRVQVSFCTRLLVKRLSTTQNWAMAMKCLVILHRCLVDGGFLFQDLLSYGSMKEGKDYLSFGIFRYDPASVDWEFCIWVKKYSRYLDERLSCSRAVVSHFDNRWQSENPRNKVEFMASGVLLDQLEALQNLLHELCQCEPGAEAGEHSVIQGALVLVVMDSYKVHEEIRIRMKEMIARVRNLKLSESLSLLHISKRAHGQMDSLETFLQTCKELRLFFDIPFPAKDFVSELEIQKLTETIQIMPKEPFVPSYRTRSTSSGGRGLGGGIPPEKQFSNGQECLQRTVSQPMSLPRRLPGINGAQNRQSPSGQENLPSVVHFSRYSCDDFVDISLDSEIPTVRRRNAQPPPATMPDLISF